MSVFNNKMFTTGKIDNSQLHNEFIELIHDRFDIKILYVEYSPKGFLGWLILYVDKSNIELRNIISSNPMHYCLNDRYKYSKEIIDCYNEILIKHKRDEEVLPEVQLYIYLFEDIAASYSINASKFEIRETVLSVFSFYSIKLVILDGGSLNFVFKNSDEYEKAEKNKDFLIIRDISFKTAKKYDRFNCLTKNNFIINFYDNNSLSPEQVFNLARGGY